MKINSILNRAVENCPDFLKAKLSYLIPFVVVLLFFGGQKILFIFLEYIGIASKIASPVSKLTVSALLLYYLVKAIKVNIQMYFNKPILHSALFLILVFSTYLVVFNVVTEEWITNTEKIQLIFHSLGTGLFEELLFRVLFFFLLLKHISLFDNNKYVAVFGASLFFGLFHAYNFMIGKFDIYSTIVQIYFAFVTGLLFQSIMVRFKNVFLVSAIHMFVNAVFGYRIYFEIVDESRVTDTDILASFYSSMISISIILLLFSPIIFLMLKAEKRSSKSFFNAKKSEIFNE
ncbi:MAG: CPBP family glutamic-type intramembrane protease [Bacteroidota bacterium]